MKKIILAFAIIACIISGMSAGTAAKNSGENAAIRPDTTILVAPDLSNSNGSMISFPSLDSLMITADEYQNNPSSPWILLCHQARFSRGEYIETATFFGSFGYNCLAIDQRSGNEANGVINRTAALAKEKKLPMGFLDAEQDIIAAVNYLYAKSGKPVILVGSSYSAGLVLKIAVNNPKVKAVLAFSPGEFYGDALKLGKTIAAIDKPVFIASSKKESAEAKVLFDGITSTEKTQFIPEGEGQHGSKALWAKNEGNEEYRMAVKMFMGGLK